MRAYHAAEFGSFY